MSTEFNVLDTSAEEKKERVEIHDFQLPGEKGEREDVAAFKKRETKDFCVFYCPYPSSTAG